MSDPNSPLGTSLHEQPSSGMPDSLHTVSRASVWMHRLLVLLFVFICAATGVLLVILPWLPQWTDNALLIRFPALRGIVAHGFFRGVCSGLGILDIWIGFSEAIHYHEDKRA